MMILRGAIVILSMLLIACTRQQPVVDEAVEDLRPLPIRNHNDSYQPEVRHEKGDDFTYTFSQRQLDHMKATPLDREKFLRYLESRWTIEQLRAYCIPEHVWLSGVQRLVYNNVQFDSTEVPVHEGKSHGFDKVWVYVCENDVEGTSYSGDARRHWSRWKYSLNIDRGDDRWAIIESLPNDFMDHPEKYASPAE